MSGREDFIAGARKPRITKREDVLYPWEESHIREDVKHALNLHLSEPFYLKLKYLSEQTNISMQQICRDILLPAIEEDITKLTKD